jgi:hypothetical protein
MLGIRTRGLTKARQSLAGALAQKSLLGCCQLRAIVAARKEMTVAIGRHLDRGVTETALHQLQRKLEAAVDASVDAPRRVEVAQGMKARVLRSTAPINDAGRDLDRVQCAPNDVEVVGDPAVAIRKDSPTIVALPQHNSPAL